MSIFTLQRTVEDIVRDAPPETVGQSPIFDHLVYLIKFCLDDNAAALLALPIFLKRFFKMPKANIPSLTALAVSTPVDQAITLAFAGQMYKKYRARESDEADPEQLFDDVVERIHCLDYLDFMRKVLRVIERLVEIYNAVAWEDFGEKYSLASDVAPEVWYDSLHADRIEDGWEINCVLDASFGLVDRLEQMHLSIGEQYSIEVLELIKQRPQHVVGSYFVAEPKNAIA